MSEVHKGAKNPDMSAFNGSLDTLSRLNQTLVDYNSYMVNSNIAGMRSNLYILYVMTKPFLSKEERVKAVNDWKVITDLRYEFTEEGLVFDSCIPDKMNGLYDWLNARLHKHEVTMASKKDLKRGFERLYDRYGL